MAKAEARLKREQVAHSSIVAARGRCPRSLEDRLEHRPPPRLEAVIVQGKLDQAGSFFVGDGSSYVQHNPYGSDGLAGLTEFLEKAGPLNYKKVYKVVGEGNFVITQAEGYLGPDMTHLAFYDMWRLDRDPKDGAPKIVEHWDCIQPISTNPQNSNGMF